MLKIERRIAFKLELYAWSLPTKTGSWPIIGRYAGPTIKHQRIVFAGSANKSIMFLYKPSDCMVKMTILANYIPEKSGLPRS